MEFKRFEQSWKNSIPNIFSNIILIMYKVLAQ